MKVIVQTTVPGQGGGSSNFWCSFQGMHFFVYSGAEAMYFSHRILRLVEEVGKTLVFTYDSHTMIHPVPYYRQQT